MVTALVQGSEVTKGATVAGFGFQYKNSLFVFFTTKVLDKNSFAKHVIEGQIRHSYEANVPAVHT